MERDNPPPHSTRRTPQAVPRSTMSAVETVIGPSCRVNGTLQTDGGVRVEGRFDGEIRITGNLVITETAKVDADVQAYNVILSGSLKGSITANRIEFPKTGTLSGNLSVNSLVFSEGAYLHGQANIGVDLKPPMMGA
jgi:cytoskeletal protein CcmA (bactofilin family)